MTSQQDFDGVAGPHAWNYLRQQAGRGRPPAKWRRRPIRGLVAVVVAVITLVEIPVQLVGRHDGPAVGVAVMFVLSVLAARRCLRRPRGNRSS